MIRYLQRLRRKKGFTLVELIIVMGIVAVLMGCIAAFSRPIQEMVRSTAVSSDALNVNEIIGDYIEGRLGFASGLRILYGVNSNPCSEFNSLASDYYTLASGTDTTKGQGGRAGALVFKYVAGGAGAPENSGYRLYDVPITSASYTAPTEDNAVFLEDFYGNTQRMIFAPLDFSRAELRKVCYITMEIYSYKCTPDHAAANIYIRDDTLQRAYNFKKGTSTDDALKDINVLRAGPLESVTFRLNNIDADDGSSYIRAHDEPGKTPVGAGSDIVIFYYIPKYAIN